MEKNHKRYLRAVLVIFITALASMKLPHSSRSAIQYIIPPIKMGDGARLYLSSILIMVAVLWSYKEIVKSHYFKTNKVLRAILILFIVVPAIFKGINMIKTPYYKFNTGLKTIEVVDSKLVFSLQDEPENNIEINLHLKNYSDEMKRFNISLEIPEKLKEVMDNPWVEFPDTYTLMPYEERVDIDEIIKFNYSEGHSRDDIIQSHYRFDNYKIHLFNEKEQLTIILNDSL